MDQDGNTAMPQKPDFSSPNSTNENQQQIAAAAASMTESDPKQAITSAPSNNGAPAHGMFGNRRFKAKNDVASTTFAGAPDFFNQAAGGNSQDFVTVGDAPVKRSINKVPIIIIIALVVVFAIVGLVAALMPKVAHNSQAASKQALNRIGNIIVYGEDKEDDLPEDVNNKITNFYDFHIYEEATNSEVAGCPDMAETISEIAKPYKDLSDFKEKIQDICVDIQYREIGINKILTGSESLERRDMVAFVEGYYETGENSSKTLDIRQKQAMTSVDKIEILSRSCPIIGGLFEVTCWDTINKSDEYVAKEKERSDYQFEYNEIVAQKIGYILDFGKEEEENEK